MRRKDDYVREYVNSWIELGAYGQAGPSLTQLFIKYSEESRKYHNISHIFHCLDELQDVWSLAEHPHEIRMAIWFHDIVYDIKAQDNEEKSALLAKVLLGQAQAPSPVVDRISGIILATKHQVPPSTNDAQLMVDIDLASLGKPAEEFDENSRKIREEYGIYPDDVYNPGRVGILKSFFDRKPLYLTEFFRQKYEDQAKINLARSIQQLSPR